MGSVFSLTKMRGTAIVCLLALGLLAAAQASDPEAQKDINALLWKPYEHIRLNKLGHEVDAAFSPIADTSMYSDDGVAAQRLEEEVHEGRVLKRKNYFSLFNPRHREEALMLFETLMDCKEWNPCFVNNAVYFRERMNEGVFIYGLYVAVIHHPIADGLVLPPLYEVTPHMFTNSEVINQAYTAKMTATPGKFNMGYTGSQSNPEQRVAYFGEDIGMNVHHVSWHMDFPFWWKDSYGYHLDRKGELFFWAHHQLAARFDSERLSNNLDIVDELYWNKPIVEGFAPHTTYRYGGEFPTRPDNVEFADVEGVVRVRDMIIHEQRIIDAIDLGYITAADGSHIDISGTDGINHLGHIVESSVYSPNRQYYGALHNEAHILLGRQSDPKGKFNLPPSVMEHFETATRDPAFFRLHKYMDNLFKHHKDILPPYTKAELEFPGVHVTGVDIEGELVTYFDDFEFDLKMAVDTSDVADTMDVKAVGPRINHKDFSYNMHISNDNEATQSVIRVYLCPVTTNQGVTLTVDQGRWQCIEMDKFWKKLEHGANHIVRKSTESSMTSPDIPSFADLIHRADEAVQNGEELDTSAYTQQCGIPNRMLLPKGKKEGMDFYLEMIVNDAAGDNHEVDEHSHGHCGVRGETYPDHRPMGFPMDRSIPDDRLFLADNIHSQKVKVYHKA